MAPSRLAGFGGAGAQLQCIDGTLEPGELSYSGIQVRNCTETARLSGFQLLPPAFGPGEALGQVSPTGC